MLLLIVIHILLEEAPGTGLIMQVTMNQEKLEFVILKLK